VISAESSDHPNYLATLISLSCTNNADNGQTITMSHVKIVSGCSMACNFGQSEYSVLQMNAATEAHADETTPYEAVRAVLVVGAGLGFGAPAVFTPNLRSSQQVTGMMFTAVIRCRRE